VPGGARIDRVQAGYFLPSAVEVRLHLPAARDGATVLSLIRDC
jgi:hypothetical protein